ncbi:1-(5-phosphoribosyl)-5-[(5-phosphoribosylamino) methylideneamino] imidazole-4-carboxamide isomerase [bacterium HR32]|jgi:phosphoribosylformimino-5-aminoimidazole carboxamide ribotide isomerase|nr:1-(5-phosphoribosyl)-5-[(5-phosphoribosylamino) methylideneamino] imidazole-4-carboxamide isomerase [bacterium HR32]
MTVLPAVDLMEGRVVRLVRGEFSRATEYAADPGAVARRWRSQGAEWVHVVDLDGAREGSPRHLHAVREVKAAGLRVQYGGGLRDEKAVQRALDAGADRVVVGTRALLDPGWLQALCARWGDRVVVAVDVRAGVARVRGWTEPSGLTAEVAARQALACGAQRLLVTDVDADGALAGPNLALYRGLAALGARVLASGGVRDVADVRALASLRLEGVVVGRALYEGRLPLPEALRAAREGA